MIHFQQKTFSDLTKDELYAILQFRIGIFMLEQRSFYIDLDDEDQNAIHFLGLAENKLMAYGRVNQKANVAEIRRICVDKSCRKNGIGSLLMQNILEYINTLATTKAELDAQLHLEEFYKKYGFKSVGKPYNDGGILHILMEKALHKI